MSKPPTSDDVYSPLNLQPIRAQALRCAVATIDPTGDPVELREVLDLADHFTAYIADGRKP